MVLVCVVGVYFGRLPDYFDLWLRSAEYNSSIDFLVVTDQKRESLPHNVRFFNMSLREMKELVEKKLGFEVSLERPYKCCDFKPVYGVIFEDLLEGYDYWAHCDFDLIWGDIRYFLTKYQLEKYDKFLPLGHFSLYKNNIDNNKSFMLSGSEVGDYITVFKNDRNYAFDEMNGMYTIFKHNNLSMFEQRLFADISKIYFRFKLAMPDKNYDYQLFFWQNGHIFRVYFDQGVMNKDEFMYIHFKERKNMHMDSNCLDSDAFLITSKGFIGISPSKIDRHLIEKYNPYLGKKYEQMELFKYEKNEKFERIKNKAMRIIHIKDN